MLPERELLNELVPLQLAGSVAVVTWKNDRRSYTLVSPIGKGQTAVAWKAEDHIGRTYAVKLVPKSEYLNHSLDAEARWASDLDSKRFAQIDFFGEIEIELIEFDFKLFYAVVVDWIPGTTLRKFISNDEMVIDGEAFCNFAKDLCEVLQELRSCHPPLTHNDLHDENLLIHHRRDPLSHVQSNQLTVIDTGQLKSITRRDAIVDSWRDQCVILESVIDSPGGSVNETLQRIRDRLEWFERTDQEWVVCHLCALFNRMLHRMPVLTPSDKRFVRDLPELLKRMVDPDRSRRIDDPRQMYKEIESLWRQSSASGPPPMSTPFDLPSAELIRSDQQLMTLFSEEYPRIDACRSSAPVYIYGPRGSGKSTILRSLSIKALLASKNPKGELEKIPFLGIYLSSSQELRSRFWLMHEPDFQVLEGHVIRYFNLLLLEALVETFEVIHETADSNSVGDAAGPLNTMTSIVAHECAHVIRRRLGMDEAAAAYAGTSELKTLKHDIQRARDDLWLKILDKSEPELRPDAQLVFDIVRDLEATWTVLANRRIVFLIDDYSNQRIPRSLQRRLNQAITFSKQGSPIFKVTSEYDGVDLEGVQEGREVNEVNVGFEYVSLTGSRRYRFLQNVLEKRFEYCGVKTDLLAVLPLSKIGPVIPMALAIRDSHRAGGRFHYHGLDTISELCSGDFAMGIDVVRRIFEHAGVNWTAPGVIAPKKQDEAIREYATQEFEYIRHQSQDGRRKYEIADKLCWLSKECILTKEVTKDKKPVPLVKNHIDISETALRDLELQYPESAQLLHDLTRTGVLFPLQSSRALEGRDATRRFMIRRILLARYTAALGRHRPIRIDDVQRLQWFLTDPKTFVESELGQRVNQYEDEDAQPPDDGNLSDNLPKGGQLFLF